MAIAMYRGNNTCWVEKEEKESETFSLVTDLRVEIYNTQNKLESVEINLESTQRDLDDANNEIKRKTNELDELIGKYNELVGDYNNLKRQMASIEKYLYVPRY